MPRIFALAALTAALMAMAVGAGPAVAGKGSNARGVDAALTVTPNPAPAGTDTITIDGSGFSANQTIMLTVAGSFPGAEVTTDANGAFSLTYVRWGGPFGSGDNWVTAFKYRGNKTVALAVEHFWVCDTDPC